MPKSDSLCKCRSHCTTLNAGTGLYEGEGQMHTRSTRSNHSRDDKLLAGRARAGSGSRLGNPLSRLLRSSDRTEKQKTWVESILAEVAFCSELSVTSPTIPLIFHNPPATGGEYTRRSNDELLYPNHGLHALKPRSRSNGAFIMMEHRLCELASLLIPEVAEDGVSDALDSIFEELAGLDAQKESHWEQQRTVTTSPHVNTGEIAILVCFPQLCLWFCF